MKLKFVKDGTIASAAKIYTPAGNFSGKELWSEREDLRDTLIDTTLSKAGRNRLNGICEDEEGNFDNTPAPEQYHILIEGWGWCQVKS